MQNNTDLATRILAAKRPGQWHTIAAREFYLETLSGLDYGRLRAAAVVQREEQGVLTARINTHDFALGMVLEAVTDWRGVLAGDFQQVELNEDEKAKPLPFSPRLLRAWLADRAPELHQLFVAVQDQHVAYVDREAADRKN